MSKKRHMAFINVVPIYKENKYSHLYQKRFLAMTLINQNGYKLHFN